MATRERAGFAHSMTDLMASVAVLFLLVAAIFMVQSMKMAKRDRERLEKAERAQKSYADQLQGLFNRLRVNQKISDIAELEYDKQKDPFVLSVVVHDTSLAFGSGACSLSDAGREVIRTRFPVILEEVCKLVQEHVIERITLEGHTDAAPFFTSQPSCGVDRASPADCFRNAASEACQRVGFENNVRLSGSRAQSVFFEMRHALDAGLRGCLDDYFVVAGRGPVEPVDGADWQQAALRAISSEANRRVVLKIRARSNVDLLANTKGSPQ